MNKLVIKQNTVTENVTVGLISKLYTEAKAIKDYEELNDVLDSQVELLGNLLVVHAYGSDVTYLETKFPNLHINVTGGAYVKFVDPLVLSILLSNNVGDGVGCTLLDLYNISSLSGNVFGGSSITSFNELLYFNPAILILANLFASCSSLTEITLPVGTTSIGSGWFGNCSNLANIGNTLNVTSIYGLGNCSSLVSIDTPALTTVGNWGCMNCTSLTTIDLSHCTSINRNAFQGCTSLDNIDLSSCTSIGQEAFMGCTSLSSVGQLNPNFTTIPNGCFRSCSSLTSIDLSNVTSVGGDYLAGAFAGCTSLINIGSLANVRHFGRECFKNCPIGTGQDLEITTTDTTWQGEQFYGTKYKSVVLHGPLLTAISSNGVYPAFNNMVNMEFIDLSDTAITSAGAYGYGTKTELIVHPSTITSVTWDALSYTNSNTTVKYIVILAETPPTLGDTRYTYLQKGNIYVKDSATVDAYKAAWPQYTYGSSNWDLHAHIKPLSELPVGVWKTGLYQLYEPYLSNSSDPAYATT